MFQKVSGTQKVKYKRESGEYRSLPSKQFYLTVPIQLVHENLSVSGKKNDIKKILFRKSSFVRGAGVSRVSLECFCLKVPKNCIRYPLVFQKNSGMEIVTAEKGGGYLDYPSKMSYLKVPIQFVDKYFCVSAQNRFQKTYSKEREIITIFVENTLSQSTAIFRRRTLLCFRRKL